MLFVKSWKVLKGWWLKSYSKWLQIPKTGKTLRRIFILRLFKNWGSFRFQSKLSTWIGQIAYNTCINYLEKKKLVLVDYGAGDDNVSEVTGDGILSRPIEYETPESAIISKEQATAVSVAINNLAPLYRLLITLYHNEELSYLEIGSITGMPDGTVKNYLFRARKQLRKNLLLTHKSF